MKMRYLFTAALCAVMFSAMPASADAAKTVIKLNKGDILTNSYTSNTSIKVMVAGVETPSIVVLNGVEKCVVDEVTADGTYKETCTVIHMDGKLNMDTGTGEKINIDFDTDKADTLTNPIIKSMVDASGFNATKTRELAANGKVIAGAESPAGNVMFPDEPLVAGGKWVQLLGDNPEQGSMNYTVDKVEGNKAYVSVVFDFGSVNKDLAAGSGTGSFIVDLDTGLYTGLKYEISLTSSAEPVSTTVIEMTSNQAVVPAASVK